MPHPSPRQLLIRLSLYFIALFAGIAAIVTAFPDARQYMPLGGIDAIEMAQLEFMDVSTTNMPGDEIVTSRLAAPLSVTERWMVLLFLAESLTIATLIMLPVAWTYAATRYEMGYRKTFVRALFILPICATTIVLLIQGSLALAFGLAAMVAAVRFRVSLQEPIDGVFIFAAICVGLAAGIGHLGVAAVMAIFFCFGNAILWMLDYGKNPVDDARVEKARAALKKPVENQITS
jgi:hypothetical protein